MPTDLRFLRKMNYREIIDGDIPTIFDLWVRTWPNPNGAGQLKRLGITPDSVRRMLRTTHRGWIAEANGSVVGFVMGNQQSG